MVNLFWLGIVGAGIALFFAYMQSRKVMKYSEGSEKMVKIAAAIRTGAKAYMKRQYAAVVKFFAIVFVILCALAFVPLVAGSEEGLVNRYAPFAFITGGFFAGLSGYIGMKVATNANARTANAATESLNKGLRVSFASGSVMGFVVVGFTLLDTTAWFLLLKFAFGESDAVIGTSMVAFGMGLASMAMFARVGGGIFTKAADVGADLVGKVEVGIPEDDPRNPAVIADNVGDNVGDVAGMGADLYEAYAHAIIATFALSFFAGYSFSGMLLPILMCVVGVLASIIGTFVVRTKEQADQKTLLRSLHKGVYLAGGISIIAALPLTFWVARITEGAAGEAMRANAWGIFGSIILGVISGFLIAFFSEYYTSDTSKPTKELAASSETGSATVMIGGLSLGMKAVVGPVLTIAGAALLSFVISGGLSDSVNAFNMGLYGIGIASVGLVATLGINLATDAFGPVADNAGGIAEMAHLPEEVRVRTDALDSLGNTTAATGKGFSIGATGFSALAMLASYVSLAETLMNRNYVPFDELADGAEYTVYNTLNLNITSLPVLMGLFIGCVTAFFFASLTISAVHKAAQSVVIEVRRQFKEIVGLMEGTADPDYAKCVDLCTQSALKRMVAPSLLAFIVPIGTGLLFGAAGVVGMLAGIVVTGFALAIFMMNSGGAWDNAKKYIEAGNHGGKGSEQHKAAVIGDTVGDPFKDTAGPSFNILITLSSAVSLVFVGVTTAFSLM
ncbi:MAG: sodium-translocating pyrophosphatase [Oscillospiraceae bacterium]|jgi:K(+)-stimulated pyrophosphate-energized sodium pump|nr:sodium-translocating pyrophosphatase [Oscillospiraceae bacterium]